MDTRAQLEKVEQDAAAWLLKRDGGGWSDGDDAGLRAWLDASPSHQIAYIRMRAAWKDMGRLNIVSGAFPAGRMPKRGEIKNLPFFRQEADAVAETDIIPPEIPQKSGRRRLFVPAAAAALIVLIAGAMHWRNDRGIEVQTQIGGLATVPTQDGSRVTVNTDTELRIVMNAQERNIMLTRGEAYFEVAKDPQRPFVVSAGKQRIVAVGTAFSVRREGESVRVLVTEGKVRVEAEAAGSAPETVELAVGGMTFMDSRGIQVQDKSPAEVQDAMSWRSGMVILRNVPLADAVAEFNRYNVRRMVLADASLKQIKVGGNFRPNNLDGFVRLLRQGFGVTARERDGQIVLKRAPVAP